MSRDIKVKPKQQSFSFTQNENRTKPTKDLSKKDEALDGHAWDNERYYSAKKAVKKG